MINHLVIVAPNWLGDAVMSLPAIRDVRRHFADARITVAARPSVASLFRAVPHVDLIVALSTGTELRETGADAGLLLPNSFRSAWNLRKAGIAERWGYRADFRSVLLTRAVKRPRGKVHFGEYYQHLVRSLGVETGPLTPQLVPPAGKIQAAERMLVDQGWTKGEPLVGIAPGAAFGHAKRWPPGRFAELITLLSGGHVRCVLLGRDEDRDASRAIEASLSAETAGKTINLVGRTDLLTLMGVISQCRAIVANDSGALHLAAALGVPVAAIYGPTDERYSKPLPSREGADAVAVIVEQVFCRPCFMRDCPIDHRCMKRITAGRVYGEVRRLLEMESAT